ncbi:MAG TPA: DJ-1/PfpI family protein [Umezawaea sp.]|nr:DJ-1/PfpI family protein [Umezawaea sp.]
MLAKSPVVITVWTGDHHPEQAQPGATSRPPVAIRTPERDEKVTRNAEPVLQRPVHGKPPEVGMMLFDKVTIQDFIGAHTFFVVSGMKVHLVHETLEPVMSDTGVAIIPDTTLDDCPKRLDVLYVPGGDVSDLLRDKTKLDFLADRGLNARYVTAVCMGSIVLAAAGLLDGYRAATHWATRPELARLGVDVSTERMCVDRNRITGGGLTAGMDFGLMLLAEIFGEDVAQLAQLGMEYDPAPPFDAGNPERVSAEVMAQFQSIGGGVEQRLTDAVSHILDNRGALEPRPSHG